MRRLFPEPSEPVTAAELAAAERRRVGERPWVGLCMIASLDGSTVVAQRSGTLSSPNDAAVLGALRRAADAIIVGAATVRVEGYGPPKKAGQRIGVVTTTGDIDATSELFASGSGFLIMPVDGPRSPATERGPVDTVRAGTGRVDVAEALARLGEVMDPPEFVQAEGGPRLNASLLEAGCVDELNLTLSPAITGGRGPRVVDGADDHLAGFTLAQLVVDERSFVFGRWRRTGAD